MEERGKKAIFFGSAPAERFEAEAWRMISRTTKQFCLHLWSFGILASEFTVVSFLFVCLFDVTAIQYKTFRTWRWMNSVRPSPFKMACFKWDFLLSKNTLMPNLFTVGSLCCFSRDLEAVWWPGGQLEARALEFCMCERLSGNALYAQSFIFSTRSPFHQLLLFTFVHN